MKIFRSMGAQKGFMNALIMFGIALIVAMMAAWAIANRGSNGSAATEQVKMTSSVILKQATDLKDGFSRAMANNVSPSQISFDATSGTGIFDPTKGYVSPQVTPIKAYAGVTPATFVWTYNKNIKVMNIGASGNADYVITLADVSVDICNRINNVIYNTNMDGPPPVGIGTLADYTLGAAIDMSATAAVDSKPDLCLTTTDGKYIYYKVVVDN